jgi:hypothetical protein
VRSDPAPRLGRVVDDMCVCAENGIVWIGLGDAEHDSPEVWHAIHPADAPRVGTWLMEAAQAALRSPVT